MSKNNAVSLEAHDNFRDPPAELAREGARRSSGTGKWSNGGGPIAAGCISGRTGSATSFGPRMSSCAPWWRSALTNTASSGFWRSATGRWGSGRRWTRRDTRHRRCWLHKTSNILNVLPKSVQPRAKQALQQIWMAETHDDAEAAFKDFVDTYGEKYPKAAEKLLKDRDDPAPHEALEGMFEPPAHAVQARIVRRKALAAPARLWKAWQGGGRNAIQRWNQGEKPERPDGRLNAARSPSTTFGNISVKTLNWHKNFP